ncbi:MAG: TolC family protein [Gammaproteobacteria bacterium]|nr:TolC family protein [Gammaproteobacteria bacterium]
MMNIKRVVVGVLLCVLPWQSVFAAKPIELTLRDAILLAMRFNPNIQSADLQRVVDRINLEAAQWAFQVQYNVTGSATYANGVTNGVGGESDTETIGPQATLLTPIGTQLGVQLAPTWSHTAGQSRYFNPTLQLNLTQPLLRGSRPDVVLAPLHTAENQEMIARLTFKNNLMQSVTDVISAWLSLIQAQNSLKVQRLSLDNSLATLNQQKAFLHAGRIAPTDLVQFDATVANQQLLLEQQDIAVGQQQRQLLITLGLNPDLPIHISNDLTLPGKTFPTLDESIQTALKNNVQYRQAEMTLRQNEISVLTAEDNARWQLNLTATRTFGGPGLSSSSGFNGLFNGSNDNLSVGLNLTVPIDNLSLKQAVVQAKIGLRQQKIAIEQAKRQLTSDVINTWNTVNSQKKQIDQARTAVELARQSLKIAETKLKFGKVTPFEVSTLQSNLTTQEITYINVKIGYVNNLARLDQMIGETLDRWGLRLRSEDRI